MGVREIVSSTKVDIDNFRINEYANIAESPLLTSGAKYRSYNNKIRTLHRELISLLCANFNT